jgi:hypothetical protein
MSKTTVVPLSYRVLPDAMMLVNFCNLNLIKIWHSVRTIEGTQHQNYVAVQSLPRVSKRVQPGRTTWRRKGWGHQLSQLKKERFEYEKATRFD